MPHLTTMNSARPASTQPNAQQTRGEVSPVAIFAPTPHRSGEAHPRAVPSRGRARALCKSCLLTLGIVLAGRAAAYATERPHTPVLSHRAIHHQAVAHRDALLAAPFAGARAESPASARPRPALYQETDGLSRDPNDCASYGCVDNGGG